MPKQTWYEFLKHPKWQRKRLEIMERAGFECEECGVDNETLNVHHGYYEKGLKPWEYPDETLSCLCEDCHKRIQALCLELKRRIGLFKPCDLERLNGYAKAMRMLDDEQPVDLNTLVEIGGFTEFFRFDLADIKSKHVTWEMVEALMYKPPKE